MILESILAVTAINTFGLLWCYTQQSDKATDLIYASSFLLLTLVLWSNHENNLIHHLVLTMIAMWSIRLGIYLFLRVHQMGKDKRFDNMRQNFGKISGFWALQTVSILILAIPLFLLFQKTTTEITAIQGAGIIIWLAGWITETVADHQKFKFRSAPSNQGKFIDSGLWNWLQHPNYLGEILCWTGIFIIVSVTLEGWEWLSIISPLWISVLLIKISGIPLLQKSGRKKYGHLNSYREYCEKTPLLIPLRRTILFQRKAISLKAKE